MEDLQGAMQLVKGEIQGQFELRRQEYKEYQQLVAKREGGEAVYPSQFKKLEDSRRAVEAFNGWRQVSGRANSGGEELFCTETMYILFNRVLLMRIFEDRGVAPRRVSNASSLPSIAITSRMLIGMSALKLRALTEKTTSNWL